MARGDADKEGARTKRVTKAVSKVARPAKAATPGRQGASRITSHATAPKEETTLPTEEQIRDCIARKAYELYQNRNGRPGDEVQDWLQAESIVKKHLAGTAEANGFA